ncbi:MAG: DUF5694 domain-containing protein [Bacteroidales bacterium]|jgi:hypothetical protein
MKIMILFFCSLLISNNLSGQDVKIPPKTKIMTLGVFHFNYPNLDVITTPKDKQISVLDEPFQSEIIAISKALEEFNPTIIAIENTPENQNKIDSLYLLYKLNKWILKKDESCQLGFRIGARLNLPRIYCVDNPGKHYENIESLLNDSIRLSAFEHYYVNSPDSIYNPSIPSKKIASIIDALYEANNPDHIREQLATYLLIPFKYEEQPGDFTGADFETGRWYNRNLRIFRNIQRIPHGPEDRILLIIGSGHLNLLNLFFDISREFEFVSPLPYLKKARNG